MLTLSVLYDNLLWITIPLLCISMVLLVRCIAGVVRLLKKSILVRVPLVEELAIEFVETGKVVLCMEGPRFSSRFARLKYSLEAEDGSAVSLHRRLFPAVTSGVSKVRMELRGFSIPVPGRYILRVEGLDRAGQVAEEEDPRNQLVFMKPHLLKSLLYTLGITLSSAAFITSLVFSLIRIFEVSPS